MSRRRDRGGGGTGGEGRERGDSGTGGEGRDRGGGDRLVWSSERGGDLRGGRGRDEPRSPRRHPRDRPAPEAPPGDEAVRIRREVKGRRGKAVTTIHGVPLAGDALRDLAADLKRRCGSGGSVKDGVIEIQGDHRDAVVAALEARGFRVKRAGG